MKHEQRDDTPDCFKCGKIQILEGNLDAWILIRMYGSSFFDSMGGLNTHSISKVIEYSDIPPEEHRGIYRKIVSFCVTGLVTKQQGR
jgi:hypothetical protein